MSDQEVLEIGDKKPPVLEMGQFWRYDGNTFCFKPDCETCRYVSTCQKKPTVIKIGSGLNIRKAFVARPGYKIVAIDYRGIELRVAALLSREPIWLRAFQEGLDLHTEMAKIAFKTKTPTKAERAKAKCANFGNLYLGSAFTLARQSNLSEPEAAYVWESWWKAVPIYKQWTLNQLEKAKSFGFIETFFKRRRNVTDLLNQVSKLEESGAGRDARSRMNFIHRTSVNSPVQGTSADLMKIALCKVQKWIEENGQFDRVRMMLTVHDEIVFEVKYDEYFITTCGILSDLMCPKIPGWDVPIETDIEYGDNWAEIRDLEKLKEECGIVVKGSDGSSSGTPVAKSNVNRDGVVIVMTKTLTTQLSLKLKSAILDAHNVDDAVKVPVRVVYAHTKLKPEGEKLVRVHEPTLRSKLRDFLGLELHSFDEYKAAMN